VAKNIEVKSHWRLKRQGRSWNPVRAEGAGAVGCGGSNSPRRAARVEAGLLDRRESPSGWDGN